MSKENPISKKRQKQIDAVNNSLLSVGDQISVRHNAYNHDFPSESKEDKSVPVVITKLLKKSIKVKHSDGSIPSRNKEVTVSYDDVTGRELWKVGANPFDEKEDHVRPVAFTLESVLFGLNIIGTKRDWKSPFGEYKINDILVKDFTWNPFIYDKTGKKQYYQRDFVWSLKDKQLLIESIYSDIDCGRILIRKRGIEELKAMHANGETELSFNDIVDGKQRLDAVRGFIMGEYLDDNGNCFGDLSFYSQHKFTNHQLFGYSELPEDSKDEDIIHQFLKLNFTGVLQSQEHIDYVKSLKGKI